MKSHDEKKTASNFNSLLVKHGANFRALDWGSRESQELRFKVLAEIGDINGADILDVGCGLGDFCGWLRDQGFRFRYTGIDIADRLVREARVRHPQSRFLVGSPSDDSFLSDEKFDYVFASGIFSTYTTDSMKWMIDSVCRMWNWSRKGIAFNSLSAWAGERDPNEFYADPLEVAGDCRSLTPWISVRHDYHPRDFSVYLYHSAPRS
jgi:SAM-dependent methyltransferase